MNLLIEVYFLYGLAFFSMGLLMAVEAGRAPLLQETRTLWPLSVFGLFHGFHEWLEMFWLWPGVLPHPDPRWEWLRIGLLVFSFLSLIAYGVQIWQPPRRLVKLDPLVAGGVLLVYLGVSALFLRPYFLLEQRVLVADALARYLLAVPGGLLGALVLRRHAQTARRDELEALARPLNVAWRALAAYALTQLFVPRAPFWPAWQVNAEAFRALIGFPVQALRAALAAVLAFGLLRAMQAAEQTRRQALFEAQELRLRALERVRSELQAREALRRDLLRRIVVAQEDERARIARELHDETAQMLTALGLTLAGLRERLRDRPEVLPSLERLQALVRQMGDSLRRLVHDLRPAQLDDLGLTAALSWLANQARQQYGVEVTLQVEGERQRLPSLVETILFRTTQEALTNAIRHGHARHVRIALQTDERETRLTICDDGAGFDVERTLLQPPGVGLAGMRERAKAIGASLELESAPGRGACVRLHIPVGKELHEREGENFVGR